jgi:hypothetical protein
MIHHVWTVFCSSSAIDRDTNQVSLFDLIEQVTVQAVEPRAAGERGVIPARFQVVTLWTRGEAGDLEVPPPGCGSSVRTARNYCRASTKSISPAICSDAYG